MLLLTESQYADFVRFLNDTVSLDSLQRNDGKRIVTISPKSPDSLDVLLCSAVLRTLAAVDFGR